tara:strand:- start:325 stop:492 length:168 start_codon:yes stop_codon:yes gene_type:complete
MKDAIGQLMSVIVIQFIISEAVTAKGVEFGSTPWWCAIIIGGTVFNIGIGLRKAN